MLPFVEVIKQERLPKEKMGSRSLYMAMCYLPSQ